MSMAGFEQLFAEADAAHRGLAVAVAGGADRTVLEALRSACDRGWIEPLVAGLESDVRRVADEGGISLENFSLLDTDEPTVAAVAAVRSGRAKFLMKGQIATPALMRAVLDSASGLAHRSGRLPDSTG